MATSERLSHQMFVTVTDEPSHVWKLFVRMECKFLMYTDVIEDAI